jgi:ABC-type multidrug transport system ATPase subunit
VLEYLEFVAKIKGVAPAGRAARVKAVMERTRIADVAGRQCGKMSKGYKQRVGLAQALIHNPDVLILDEPTAGLDPKQIIETRQLIKELAGDHTIILSTHILPEVSQTCQRVVIINKGRVVAIDTCRSMSTAPMRRLSPARWAESQVSPASSNRTGGSVSSGSKSRVRPGTTSGAIWRKQWCRTAGACSSCGRCA